jgi:hypothetical protein
MISDFRQLVTVFAQGRRGLAWGVGDEPQRSLAPGISPHAPSRKTRRCGRSGLGRDTVSPTGHFANLRMRVSLTYSGELHHRIGACDMSFLPTYGCARESLRTRPSWARYGRRDDEGRNGCRKVQGDPRPTAFGTTVSGSRLLSHSTTRIFVAKPVGDRRGRGPRACIG